MPLVLAYVNTALKGTIDLHHSISKAIKICYLILWFMFLFVLNVTQRKRALSRRTKETEAASNKENKYLYRYFYTLFCTLCNYKVSAILHTGKDYWDVLLTRRSRACWTRKWFRSPVKISCTVSTPMTEIAFTELTKLWKMSQHLPDTTLMQPVGQALLRQPSWYVGGMRGVWEISPQDFAEFFQVK